MKVEENKKTPLREKLESLEKDHGVIMPKTLEKQVIDEDGTFLVVDYIRWYGARFHLVCSEFKGNEEGRIIVISGSKFHATKIVSKGLIGVGVCILTVIGVMSLISSIIQ